MIRSAPQTSWIVQPDGVLLVSRAARKSLFVSYPEAAVWDLLTRHSTQEVARKLVHIADLSAVRAVELVEECIERWVSLGYLEREPVNG